MLFKNRKKYGVEIAYNYNKEIILRKMGEKENLMVFVNILKIISLLNNPLFLRRLENGEKITIVFDLNILIKTTLWNRYQNKCKKIS